MTTELYASANRVFWIVDNGSSHRGAAAAERMTTARPNAQLIHLPAHASWLDQAEIYFSVGQRKVLTPNDFTGLDQIRDRPPHSRSAITPSPGRLSGNSPAPTSATCRVASTPTSRPRPTPWQHDPYHRRTYEPDRPGAALQPHLYRVALYQ
jgi:hypothetical protein